MEKMFIIVKKIKKQIRNLMKKREHYLLFKL
jgi:hypothetical protein